MTFVRTVLGDIAPEDLGRCGAHEHIVIAESYATVAYPEFRLDDVGKIADELRRFHGAGGRAMIDSMPCDAGRDVLALAEVSRASDVHIVAPTGAHLAKYYPPRHWTELLSISELTSLFIADIETGIDALDYGGPIVKRTEHHAGIIKVAGGRDQLSDREVRIFTAAAQAHGDTGCPILTHTEQGTAAIEQLDILERSGADLTKVTLSHCDRNPNPDLHRRLLDRGCRLEYDSAFRWKGSDNPTLSLISDLAPAYPDQLMLGMDAARPAYWKAFGGEPGLDFLLTTFTRKLLDSGLSRDLVDRIFIDNPAAAFAFKIP